MSGPVSRLLRLLGPERHRVTLAVLLQVLTIGSGVGLMATSAWLLSRAALHPSIAVLGVAIVGVRAFGISRAGLRYLERLVSHDVTLRLLARLRVRLFRALVPLAPARLFPRPGGDLLGRAIDDVAMLEGLYARLAGPTLAAVGVALLVGLLLWPRAAALGVAALLGLGLGGFLVPWLASRRACRAGHQLVDLRGQLTARLVDGLRGCPDLLALGREGDHAAAVATLDREVVSGQRDLARASSLGGALAVLITDLTAVAVLALAVPSVRGGRVDGVELAMLVLLTLASFEAVAPLPAAWHALGAMDEAGRRLFDLMDAAPAVAEPTGAAPEPLAGAPLVEVRHLSFTYPGASRPALDDVSLRLEPGRRIAVVGPSGSGKSTLIHLLLRFWEAPAGAVFLDGHDLRDWPSDLARARMAFAAQRAHVFTGTLRENPLLLLDEPTAHLDPVTEREVLAEIVRAGEERATLLVTHRLVGLEAFDEVLVLDRGQVAERGPAAELVARGGALARLVALQRSAELLSRGGVLARVAALQRTVAALDRVKRSGRPS
jgi:thiol reductant ABC exporter CydC subunit